MTAVIKGIASATPEKTVSTAEDCGTMPADNIAKLTKSTGIVAKQICSENQCASDLCFVAAKALLTELNWSADSIDILLFVSQTPDHLLPATSCSLHARLGLGKNCQAMDIALGCSGYVYGLSVANALLQSGQGQRALLLVGDTISKIVSPDDNSTKLLFGDAGSATALELAADKSENRMTFEMGTDGTGAANLIAKHSGFRNQTSQPAELFMDGAEIFSFALKEIPGLVNRVLEKSHWSHDSVDYFVFHQANAFMLKQLAKKLKIPAEKMVIGLTHFGNTSCASIPLAISTQCQEALTGKSCRLVLVGFGVGYSWGAVTLTTTPEMVLPPLVTLQETQEQPSYA